MSAVAPTTVSPATQPAIPAVSSKGSFVVDSYSPTHGSTGILFTVNLTCTNFMSANVVAQLDIRLVIEGKYIYSKLFKGPNGQVTLRALLGDSLASLCGRVPLCMLVFDNGSVFDYCVFGDFDFVAPAPAQGKLYILRVHPDNVLTTSPAFSPTPLYFSIHQFPQA